METSEIQRLKMAWLVAKEAGDTHEQTRLLRDYPEAQETMINFIAAYSATGGAEGSQMEFDTPLLALTQRATRRALDRVFASATTPITNIATLSELRKSRNLSKIEVAKGLRLGVDVWNKFEEGAIELLTLSQRQLGRLAQFFQVSADQFGDLLTNSQPAISLNRRQTRQGANREEQSTPRQSLTSAIQRSAMSPEDQQFWLDE
jgi:transcriptional regulator with XRE-family HTH domain